MRAAVLAVVALAALPSAAVSAHGRRSLTLPAPIANFAFDGARAAVTARGECGGVRMWRVTLGKVVTLGRIGRCPETSTGAAIAAVAIARERVLWLEYAGGNLREWSLLTATPSRPRPRLLRFVTRDVDEPPPLVVGDADASRLGDVLPYALDRTVFGLRSSGARGFAWTAPARVVSLSANAGELAVATAGGRVFVLDAGGRVLREERYAGGEIRAVKITGTSLAVLRGRTLEVRGGGRPQTWTLPAGAALNDAEGTRAYFVAAGRVHELSLVSGSDRVIATGSLVQVENLSGIVASRRRLTTLKLR